MGARAYAAPPFWLPNPGPWPRIRKPERWFRGVQGSEVLDGIGETVGEARLERGEAALLGEAEQDHDGSRGEDHAVGDEGGVELDEAVAAPEHGVGQGDEPGRRRDPVQAVAAKR